MQPLAQLKFTFRVVTAAEYLLLLISFTVLTCIQSFSQSDSIETENSHISDSISQLIKSEHEEILLKLSEGDYDEVRNMIGELNAQFEKTEYAVFEPLNLVLILFWIHDYSGLVDYITHFDSIQTALNLKIKPNNIDLYLELSWSLPEAAKGFIQSINQSDLDNECKDLLKLYYCRLAFDIDYTDACEGITAKKFLKRYPKSSFRKFVEAEILLTPYFSKQSI